MPDYDPPTTYDTWRHVPRDTLRSRTEWWREGRRPRDGARPAAEVWARAGWSTRRSQRPVDLYDVADTEPRPLRGARRRLAAPQADAPDPEAAGVPDLSAAVLALPPPRAR